MKTEYKHKHEVGEIFKQTTKDGVVYWKIIELRKKPNNSNSWIPYASYQCIKCSKTGKEYKYKTCFKASFIDTYNECREWIAHADVGIKANIDEGIKIGKKKARAKYLKLRIKNDTKELEKILKELGEQNENDYFKTR